MRGPDLRDLTTNQLRQRLSLEFPEASQIVSRVSPKLGYAPLWGWLAGIHDYMWITTVVLAGWKQGKSSEFRSSEIGKQILFPQRREGRVDKLEELKELKGKDRIIRLGYRATAVLFEELYKGVILK